MSTRVSHENVNGRRMARVAWLAMLGCCLAIGCGDSPEEERRTSALQYIPDESFMVLSIDVSTAVQSDVGKDLMKVFGSFEGPGDAKAMLDRVLKMGFGIGLDDIDSITFGGSLSDREPVVVFHLAEAVDVDSVLDEVVLPDWDQDGDEKEKAWEKSTKFKTGTLYLGRGWQEHRGIWFPDDRTLVSGPTDVLKEIAKRNGPAELSEQLAQRIDDIDFSQVFAVAMEVPDMWEKEGRKDFQREAPFLSTQLIDNLKVGSLVISQDDDEVRAVLIIQCDEQTATDLSKLAEAVRVLLKQVVSVEEEAREAIEAAEITASGDQVQVELAVPNKVLVETLRGVQKAMASAYEERRKRWAEPPPDDGDEVE